MPILPVNLNSYTIFDHFFAARCTSDNVML